MGPFRATAAGPHGPPRGPSQRARWLQRAMSGSAPLGTMQAFQIDPLPLPPPPSRAPEHRYPPQE